MRKSVGWLMLLCILFTATLNVGTVRKKQTHMTKAQTGGIKLSDKLEELKDGEKGPATPTFGWYGGKNGFMSAPPYSKEKPQSVKEPLIPMVSEVDLPEMTIPSMDEYGDHPESASENWDEDWNAEASTEEEAEALWAADDIEGDSEGVADSTQDADTSRDKKASNWDKDWWDEI